MKQNIKIIALAFLSGMAGTYAYNRLMPVSEGTFSNISYTPTTQNTEAPFARFAADGPKPAGTATVNNDFVLASSLAAPCVVYIKTVSQQQQTSMFDFLFNGGGAGKQLSSGSGVIYTPDGYVITNNHVVANAENIDVIHEKRTYKARIVGTDPNTDLAVLKLEGKGLPFIKLADSRKVQVGEWVVAVGNPFNLTSTVTAGIVSAKGRNLNIVNSQFPIESFIQTDAAINPGNSGGALVNLRGELIGINTAIYSQTGSYAGYGFAVPTDIVSKVVRDLIKYGEVQKSFIGADVKDIDSDIAKKNNLADLQGVLVTNVQPDGAADKAGLKTGDVILKIDEATILSRATYDEEINYRDPGNRMKVTYKRGSTIGNAVVTLTNREGTTAVIKREIYSSKGLGAQLESISKVERDAYKIESGVRIVKITANGIISQLGLPQDFIITSVNNRPVKNPEDLEDVLNHISGRVILQGINTDGQHSTIQFYY